MCQTGLAVEQIGKSKDGNSNFDHVTLRARTQEDNCTCLVFIKNQSLFSAQMYIEPYERLQSSAPKESECGLELYLDIYQEETLKTDRKMFPIKCTSGQTSRALSFSRNNVLSFTSKVIDGNITRGYCIDIQRGKFIILFRYNYLQLPLLRTYICKILIEVLRLGQSEIYRILCFSIIVDP